MTVEAYAKVNLTLEVFGRRADGYHALRSVVAPISLSDTLDVRVTDDGTVSSDAGYVDDLCVKAAKALRGGRSDLGARISVVKRIPAGGGLGGGSADAAAVLGALNEAWGLSLSRKRLAEIGIQVGSDVPALLLNGPVVMEGRGEIVRPLERFRTLHLVLVNPGVPSSTKEVYAACSPRRADGADVTARMEEALASGSLERIAATMRNDLQEPAVRLHPEIESALAALRAVGTVGAMMSGSGSCVFGIALDSADANRIVVELVRRGIVAHSVDTVP